MKKNNYERKMARDTDSNRPAKPKNNSKKKQENNCIFSKQFFINGAGLRQF